MSTPPVAARVLPVTRAELVRLAVPAAASAILNNAYRLIDQFLVQWLGTAAQAAIGSCTFVLILCFACYALVSAGAGPVIARATGAGDTDWQRMAFGRAIVGAVIIGVVVLGCVGLGAAQVASAVGLTGEAAAQAATYLRALALFGLPIAVAPLVDATFIATGDTRTPMLLQVLSTVLNGVLSVALMYGLGWGIAGAAAASGLATGVSVLIGLTVLTRRLGVGWRHLGLGPQLREILRLGAPIGLNTAWYAGVYWALLAWAISPLGPEVNAALGIGFSALEGVTWPLFHGISLAVASIVGRQLGAGQPEQARAAVRMAFPLSTAAGLGAAAAFALLARPLCGAFTQDPVVLHHAVLYAHVLAWSQLLVAWEALAEGTLAGAGATRTVFWWSAPLNFCRVPLGVALAHPLGWGAAGVWWAINLTTLVKALGKGAAVVRGDWTRVELTRSPGLSDA